MTNTPLQDYNLDVLGVEISFKANADPARLEQARQMLNKRYDVLRQHGRHLSKEKLLTFLALALADDLIVMGDELENTRLKVREILNKIENA